MSDGDSALKTTDDVQPSVLETPSELVQIRALTFDIIGTTFDFYGSLERGAPPLAAKYDLTLNPASFAYDSYLGYGQGVESVNDGGPWTPCDTILYDATTSALPSLTQLGSSASSATDDFVGLWRMLTPWPDVQLGLDALHTRYTLAVLSNMSVATQSALISNASLPFTRMLSAEAVQKYKPNPAVYEMAMSTLGLQPAEILMVAAHDFDLVAAKAQGMRTAFVARPQELGTHASGQSPSSAFDYNATTFIDLARQLGLTVLDPPVMIHPPLIREP